MSQPIRVLIADDHPRSRHGLRALLNTSTEVKVVGEAADGQEAVQLVADCQPDVVLMDRNMPEMNGLILLREIKKINPEVDVVVMTAYSNVEDAVDAMKAGAIDYLQKPIDLEQLDIVLKKVMDRRQLISENRTLKQA